MMLLFVIKSSITTLTITWNTKEYFDEPIVKPKNYDDIRTKLMQDISSFVGTYGCPNLQNAVKYHEIQAFLKSARLGTVTAIQTLHAAKTICMETRGCARLFKMGAKHLERVNRYTVLPFNMVISLILVLITLGVFRASFIIGIIYMMLLLLLVVLNMHSFYAMTWGVANIIYLVFNFILMILIYV